VKTYDEVRSDAEKIADAALKTRVIRGIELLQKKHGDGWIEIDLKTLDLRDGDRCVLGQLYGDYEQGLEALAPRECAFLNGTRYAFDITDLLDYECEDQEYDDLDDAWRLVLG
jgi:hypothetical protein